MLLDTHLIGTFVALIPCIIAVWTPRPVPYAVWIQAAGVLGVVLTLARSPNYQSFVAGLPGVI